MVVTKKNMSKNRSADEIKQGDCSILSPQCNKNAKSSKRPTILNHVSLIMWAGGLKDKGKLSK